MRYVITGGSGYIGSRLVERLSEREDTERIVICDVRPPRSFRMTLRVRVVDRAGNDRTVSRRILVRR